MTGSIHNLKVTLTTSKIGDREASRLRATLKSSPKLLQDEADAQEAHHWGNLVRGMSEQVGEVELVHYR